MIVNNKQALKHLRLNEIRKKKKKKTHKKRILLKCQTPQYTGGTELIQMFSGNKAKQG